MSAVQRARVGGRGVPAGPLMVDVALLVSTKSPRSTGISCQYVSELAQLGELPPILVQRVTGRVVDGRHRLQAAIERGDRSIAVEYFDGDDFQCFVRAVQSNLVHGRPLTVEDREQAVLRILAMRPDWSDRAIAEVTGFSPPTVASVRARSTASLSQSNRRVGRDGRIRPLDAAQGRRAAEEVIRARPDLSLREVARRAGISVGTAHSVRAHLRFEGRQVDIPVAVEPDGTAPHPPGPAAVIAPRRRAARRAETERDNADVLRALSLDPSFRLTSRGRIVLRWLGILFVTRSSLTQFADSIPSHWVADVARMARDCSTNWQRLAEELERRVESATAW